MLLEHLLIVGGVAIVFAAMLDTAPEVVIGVLCGTCIAVQLLAPWQPRMRPGATAGPSPAPTRSDSGHAASMSSVRDEQPVSNPLPSDRPSTTVIAFKLARQSLAAGRFVIMSPIRLLLRIVAFAVTLASLLLAGALALDLPGWLASGRVDPRIPRDMRSAMGVENWPFVLRSLGGVALFVTACLALMLIIWVRRSRGTTHLLRGIAGAALLMVAPFVLASHGIDWTVKIEPMRSGWAAWQELVQVVSAGAAMRAAILFIGGMILFLWPAAPRRVVSAAPQTPTSDMGQALAAGAQK